MKRQRVVIEDLMQKDFSYFLTEPLGKNFHKTFCPELTPKEMFGTWCIWREIHD